MAESNLKNLDTDMDKQYYDSVAISEGKLTDTELVYRQGLFGIPSIFHPLVTNYYDAIENNIKPEMKVLELGCGTGQHSGKLIEMGANLTVLDISNLSLKICKRKHNQIKDSVCANIEEMPMPDESFDVIVSYGALSYGEPNKVNSEIFRLLKHGGTLIVRDTLNHNFAYKLSRWIEYKFGKRSKSTIEYMPNISRITSIRKRFENSELYFYGSYLWFFYPMSKILGMSIASNANSIAEQIFPSKKKSFGFILICTKFMRSIEVPHP